MANLVTSYEASHSHRLYNENDLATDAPMVNIDNLIKGKHSRYSAKSITRKLGKTAGLPPEYGTRSHGYKTSMSNKIPSIA